jgi:hypothetical protein
MLMCVIARLTHFNINGRRNVNVYRRMKSLTAVVLFVQDADETKAIM